MPTGVLAGNVKLALAAPAVTAPDVTGLPITVAPCNTVNVTVPEFTVIGNCVAKPLITVADSVTDWLDALKFTTADPAAVIVEASVTVSGIVTVCWSIVTVAEPTPVVPPGV
jgi:hypothetical protein